MPGHAIPDRYWLDALKADSLNLARPHRIELARVLAMSLEMDDRCVLAHDVAKSLTSDPAFAAPTPEELASAARVDVPRVPLNSAEISRRREADDLSTERRRRPRASFPARLSRALIAFWTELR